MRQWFLGRDLNGVSLWHCHPPESDVIGASIYVAFAAAADHVAGAVLIGAEE